MSLLQGKKKPWINKKLLLVLAHSADLGKFLSCQARASGLAPSWLKTSSLAISIYSEQAADEIPP